MNRVRLVIFVLCLMILSAFGVNAQETPFPLPFSPDVSNALPVDLRNDPRASNGAVVISEFNQVGCAENQTSIDITFIIPPAEVGNYSIRATLRQQYEIYSDQYVSFTNATGSNVWTLDANSSGGPTNHAFPLASNVETVYAVLLLNQEGVPVWYTEGRFVCNGTATAAITKTAAVNVISVNSGFDKAGTTNTLASKWKFTGNVKRNCGALSGDCALAMTATNIKEAHAVQKRVFNTPFGGVGEPFGFVVIYDTAPIFVPGVILLSLGLDGDTGGNRGGFLRGGALVDSPTSRGKIFGGMNHTGDLTDVIDETLFTLTYKADADAKSKVLIRAAYVWVADF